MSNNKYYNIKTTTSDGITHDSRREANRWCELKLLERAGKISDLKRQVKFVLIPAQSETYVRYGKNGQRLKDGERVIEKECAYIADFMYIENSDFVVEDVKSPATRKKESYIIKRKLMLWIHDIKIKEI